MTDHGKQITNHAELKFRIMQLNALKEEQEEKIRINIREIGYSMQPEVLLKNTWKNLTGNQELKQEAGKVGIGLGVNFLIGKFLGRNNSVKGYLSSVLLEKVVGGLINKHSDLLTTGLHKLGNLFKKS